MAIELRMLLKAAEGALIRVLGTIERRGFTLQRLSTQPRGAHTEMRLEIEPAGRPIDVLVRQLKRLYDVIEASFDVPQAAFALPGLVPAALPRQNRRGLSFHGIPERAGVAHRGSP
jgi:acetolactate synthase II small subunit